LADLLSCGEGEREKEAAGRCLLAVWRLRTGGGETERDGDECWRFLVGGEFRWRSSRDDGRRGRSGER